MRENKLPQYIINAVRRRARAAAEWKLADERISAYCKQRGLDSEYVNYNVHAVVETNPDFFIRDLEECITKKAQKGVEA